VNAPAMEELKLRIVVHDYAGHMFPLDLSRRLAGWGHEVSHLHCADVETPRGRLERGPGDPPGFVSEAVTIGRIVPKYDLARRWMLEWTYGGILARRILALDPDVVLSGNTPPASQARLARALARAGVPLVAWVQDLFTPGVERATRSWPGPARTLARTLVARTEFGAMRRAAALVVISPDFPAEIRAPAGTLPGVSGFQVQFGAKDVFTPGDSVDALIAMPEK